MKYGKNQYFYIVMLDQSQQWQLHLWQFNWISTHYYLTYQDSSQNTHPKFYFEYLFL